MIVMLCTDERDGMLFGGRRQSQDRLLRQDVLRQSAGSTLWMNAYSARQFAPLAPHVRVSEAFLSEAQPGDYCFVENTDLLPWLDRVEAVIRYGWNRHYPSDVRLPFSLTPPDWQLCEQTEFAGSSHETITKEVYRHENLR